MPQYVVGAMYYTGNAVPQDEKLAVSWFRKAAEQGHPDAQYALGLMYRYHVAGMPQDMVIAYMLWNLAAANGHKNALAAARGVARTDERRAARGSPVAVAQLEAGHGPAAQSRTGSQAP